MLEKLRPRRGFGRLAQLVERLVYTEELATELAVYCPLTDERSVIQWRTNQHLRANYGPPSISEACDGRRYCDAAVR
jgi:hypothetical protein